MPSVIRTDVAIPADVSNWGCYALSAALSHIWGESVRSLQRDERAMLEALVGKNVVDGISKPELTVDGFGIEANEEIIAGLYEYRINSAPDFLILMVKNHVRDWWS